MTDIVLYEPHDGIAHVTLNRPDQRNAINAEMCAAMRAVFDWIEDDNSIRATVLSGAGDVFSAGMDLKAFAAGEGDAILFGEHGFAGFVKRQRRKPVIAAVHGAALAGGFEVMLACDLVIAAQDTRFGLPEAKIGLFAGAGGVLRLSQSMSRVQANEILLTGRTFDAETAHRLGLVNNVVPMSEAQGRAVTLAKSIAANAPLSIEASLNLSNAAYQGAEDWAQNDAKIREIGRSKDSREGALSFIERRDPVWTGQ